MKTRALRSLGQCAGVLFGFLFEVVSRKGKQIEMQSCFCHLIISKHSGNILFIFVNINN